MTDRRQAAPAAAAVVVLRRDSDGGAWLRIPERPDLDLPYSNTTHAQRVAREFLLAKGGGLLRIENAAGQTVEEETIPQPAWLAALNGSASAAVS